jgi:hypothetical protein
MSRYGIRYVVVAIGTPDDHPTEEESESFREIVDGMIPFKATLLSERVSDRLTVELLRERGAFGGVDSRADFDPVEVDTETL